MNQEKGGIFYGWYMVAVGFIVNFFIFGISVNTFTVYVKPIQADLGWTRGEISLAMGLAPLAMGLAAPFIGGLIDRVGARWVMAAGAAIVGVCSIMLAATQSLSYYYTVYIIAGIGQGCATIIPISLVISNWFNVKRGKALGIVMTGTGLGAMVMVPVTAWLVEEYGWRSTIFIMGWIILLMVPLDLLFISTRPSDKGLQPDGGIAPDHEPQALTGLSLPEALKTSSFWLIGVMMFLAGLVGMGIGVHQMAYLTDIGHSIGTAAFIIFIISGFTVLGKMTMGYISDKWGTRQAIFLTFAVVAVGVLLLINAQSMNVAYVYAVIYGFAIGAPLVLNPALAAECVGLKNFGAIFGILTLLSTLGVGIGAYTTGVVYDETGSYHPAFKVFIALAVVSAICGVLARPKVSTEEAPDEALPEEA
jgi:sugar phosphate permease